jgi:WXG100 family type VII secretion target
MAQAIVDPAELRRFAHLLRQFTTDLESQLSSLHGQLQNLSSTWRDQEQIKFADAFEETMRAMSKFAEATNEHIPFLLRKAQRAEDYLQQR